MSSIEVCRLVFSQDQYAKMLYRSGKLDLLEPCDSRPHWTAVYRELGIREVGATPELAVESLIKSSQEVIRGYQSQFETHPTVRALREEADRIEVGKLPNYYAKYLKEGNLEVELDFATREEAEGLVDLELPSVNECWDDFVEFQEVGVHVPLMEVRAVERKPDPSGRFSEIVKYALVDLGTPDWATPSAEELEALGSGYLALTRAGAVAVFSPDEAGFEALLSEMEPEVRSELLLTHTDLYR